MFPTINTGFGGKNDILLNTELLKDPGNAVLEIMIKKVLKLIGRMVVLWDFLL